MNKEIKFTIIMTGYNNGNYISESINSALNQDYSNYDIIYIDDASSDVKCSSVLETFKNEGKIKIIQNKERSGKLSNLFKTIQTLDKNTVVLELDGDDYLINDQVLKIFNLKYDQNNSLIVYANYINNPPELAKKLNIKNFYRPVPYLVKKLGLFRKYGWIYSGLRSYKAGLFQAIKVEDLKHEDKFLNIFHDAGMFFPMLEMAGSKVTAINEPQLLRNIDNPINDFKNIPQETDIIKKRVLRAKKYDKISLENF